MSASFTPGPWETRHAVQPDNTGGFDIAIVADGGIIAEAFQNVGYGPDGLAYRSTPTAANARLIAAAPELLAEGADALDTMTKLRADLAETDAELHAQRIAVLDLNIASMGATIAQATGAA